ncbi:MAG: aminodeoxychorismate synthase component I [Eubacteriales bacterium]
MKSNFCITEEYSETYKGETIIKYFSGLPNTVILESSMYSENLGRYSIIGIDPFLFFSSKGNKVTLTRGSIKEDVYGNPFEVLRSLLKEYKTDRTDTTMPFCGGCMGYFSYDLLNFIEEIKQKNYDDLDIDDMALGFYNKVIIIDHALNKLYIICSSIGMDEACKQIVINNIQIIKKIIEEAKIFKTKKTTITNQESKSNITSNFDKQRYIDMVENAREYIRNGDIYQVNLSQRFESSIAIEPKEIYFRLRECSPAPFSAYLNFDKVKVISSSPERFLKISGRDIETRPIKGTRPRGSDVRTDELMKNELLNSEKEHAELTMIVDLERNDLGKICELGSIVVQSHFEIEAYVNVFHAVSTVSGKLKDDIDIIDCLFATFPGGSITGAPKIRAMEVIEELEPIKRGIYTGAVGYIGFDGTTDLNIAIRSIIVKDKKAFYNVGGGIVWDSIAENEYEETLHKGSKMMEVLTGGCYDK